MIAINVTGTMPTIKRNPIPDAMKQCAELMQRSITMNFLMSGRPAPWTPLKSGGETPLVGTGRMMRTVSSNFGPGFAEAGMLSNFPAWYWIHQMGGWAGRNHASHIPARPFVVFQEQDRHAILALIPKAIFGEIKHEPIR